MASWCAALERAGRVNHFGSRAGLETTLTRNTELDPISWDRLSPAFKISKIFSLSVQAPSSPIVEERICPLSLVLWREPLNPWNFPSDRNFFVINGGYIRPHLSLCWSWRMRADHARKTTTWLEGWGFEPGDISLISREGKGAEDWVQSCGKWIQSIMPM